MSLKKLLALWKFENVRFDSDSGTISSGGSDILHGEVSGFEFALSWLDDTWKQWRELQEDPQFRELVTSAKGKLEKASQFATKGKGKTIMKGSEKGGKDGHE